MDAAGPGPQEQLTGPGPALRSLRDGAWLWVISSAYTAVEHLSGGLDRDDDVDDGQDAAAA